MPRRSQLASSVSTCRREIGSAMPCERSVVGTLWSLTARLRRQRARPCGRPARALRTPAGSSLRGRGGGRCRGRAVPSSSVWTTCSSQILSYRVRGMAALGAESRSLHFRSRPRDVSLAQRIGPAPPGPAARRRRRAARIRARRGRAVRSSRSGARSARILRHHAVRHDPAGLRGGGCGASLALRGLLQRRSSVRLVDHARYACGPPHALAPTPIVRHCASLSHAASPIKASTLAVAAGAGTGSTPAQAVDMASAAVRSERRANAMSRAGGQITPGRTADGRRDPMAESSRRPSGLASAEWRGRMEGAGPPIKKGRSKAALGGQARLSGCRRTRSSTRVPRSPGRCS